VRVVTRAASMASMVSGRPGPVPGGGGNCARVVEAKSAVASKSVAGRMRFKWPPKNVDVDSLPAPEGRKRLAQGVSPGIFAQRKPSAGGAADFAMHRIICRPSGAQFGVGLVPSAYALG